MDPTKVTAIVGGTLKVDTIGNAHPLIGSGRTDGIITESLAAKLVSGMERVHQQSHPEARLLSTVSCAF